MVINQCGSCGIVSLNPSCLSINDIPHLNAPRLKGKLTAFHTPVGQGLGSDLDVIALAGLIQRAEIGAHIVDTDAPGTVAPGTVAQGTEAESVASET